MTSEQLASIIDYMTLESIVFSTGLTNGTKFLTKQGENITILHSGNNVYINSAQLLSSDILIANGVLHIIDNVLNPQGPGAQPNPQIASQAPVFASASQVESLPFTASIPCTANCPVSTTSSGASSITRSAGGAGETSAGETSAGVKATSTFSSSSSKGQAAAMAKETGFKAAGLMVALGGAVLMI
jgi:hypothetical protein